MVAVAAEEAGGSGIFETEEPKPIKSDIYYCYRTLDNQIPWNKENGNKIKTYEPMYIHSSVVTYNAGHSSQTIKT